LTRLTGARITGLKTVADVVVIAVRLLGALRFDTVKILLVVEKISVIVEAEAITVKILSRRRWC
jgi:hypothetical protein